MRDDKQIQPWRGANDTGIDDDEILRALKQRYRASEDLSREWRYEAGEMFDLDAGRQWSAEDLVWLEKMLRPSITFNLMAKYVDAVSGLQVANRMEVKYSPRELGDAKVNELMTSAADWAHDRCNSGPHNSQAFRDMVLCGMGWTETFVDMQDDPEGVFKVERRDPLEMYWDPSARLANLADARYIIRVRYTPVEVVEEMFPEFSDEISNNANMGIDPVETFGDSLIHDATNAWRYDGSDLRGDVDRRLIPLVDYQWTKREDMVRVISQIGNKDVTPRQWAKLKIILDSQRIPYRIHRFRGRKWMRAFCASNLVLGSGESPYQEGFTYGAVTGKWDRNRNCWYGLGRALEQPQRMVNKILSETVYILSTQAKGGLIAELSAFEEPEKAEADWAKPDSIVWTEPGAVAQGKIMPKPQSQIPQGFADLLRLAMSSLPEVTGLNLEIMGMADKVQAGIVETQRKQAAMTILQWAFDSFRTFLLNQGKQTACYIRDYLSDGRLVRITGGEGDEQYMPLIKDKLTFDFDVIVEESPSSPNQRERTFAIMRELLPILQAEGKPLPPEFWKYSPLPDVVANALAQAATPDPAQQQKAQQERDAMVQLEMGEKQATIAEKQAKAQAAAAKAQTDAERNQIEKAKLEKELRLVDAEVEAKRAAAEKDRAEADAQEIENTYFRAGRALPVAERKVSNG